MFCAVVGWRGRRAGSCPVAAATTPDDLGCPCSAAPQSRPAASSSATATPRLNPLSSARRSNSHYAMAMAAQIRNPKSETRRKSEIRRPIPPAHPLTQRRRDSQRFAESSLALRFSAFLCVSALSPVPESETRSPSLPLINTQLQLGEPRPRCGPTVSTVSPDFCP